MRPRNLYSWLLAAALTAGALPAYAQLAQSYTDRARQGTDEDQGLVVAPLGGTGLSLDRSPRYGGGLRLLPNNSGAFVGYRIGNWTVGSALHQEDGHADRPAWLDLGASYGFNLTPKQRITLDGGVSLRAPGPWNPRVPSLSLAEPSEPGAGLRLSWQYNFGRNHYFSTTLGFDHRFDSPWDDGPEAERNAATFGTFYGYRFW